ncbi:MAG: portal protein, partial [Alphaproteobacteria bacterium]
KKIPNLPKEAIEPAVATGLEALGRGQDLNKLQMFVEMMIQLAGIQDEDLNMADMKLRVANSLGIDSEGLLLTEEQKQAKMQQMAEQQAMQQGGASMGAAAGQMGAEMGAQAMQEQM